MDTQKETSKNIENRRRPTSYLAPFDEMERAFENFFHGGWAHPFSPDLSAWPDRIIPFKAKFPKLDVIDKDDMIIVRAEAPGVKREDLDVSISGNTLMIEGHTKEQKEEEKENYYRREISKGEFSRSIMLPAEVDDANTKAVFSDGVLELTLPKKVTSKRRKLKIED